MEEITREISLEKIREFDNKQKTEYKAEYDSEDESHSHSEYESTSEWHAVRHRVEAKTPSQKLVFHQDEVERWFAFLVKRSSPHLATKDMNLENFVANLYCTLLRAAILRCFGSAIPMSDSILLDSKLRRRLCLNGSRASFSFLLLFFLGFGTQGNPLFNDDQDSSRVL